MNLDTLYEQHHQSLVRYLSRYTGDPEEAADAAHEAFLRLVEQPPEHRENLRAWLFVVATNVVRDNWRKRHRALLLDETSVDPTASEADDPEGQLEREERVQLARRLLAKVSARDRMVLLMREEGFSHQEIAEAVGTTTRSVGTMIARALKKLSRHVRETKEHPE